MKSPAALLLQIATVCLGIGVLGFMLWEPHIEGRNAHATNFEVYFKDPFLAYVYAGSIPFFVALHRAFGLFGHVRQTGTFSQQTVEALQSIKRCAIVLIGAVAGGAVIILMIGDKEDRPVGIVMSFAAALVCSIVALASAVSARHLSRNLMNREDTP